MGTLKTQCPGKRGVQDYSPHLHQTEAEPYPEELSSWTQRTDKGDREVGNGGYEMQGDRNSECIAAATVVSGVEQDHSVLDSEHKARDEEKYCWESVRCSPLYPSRGALTGRLENRLNELALAERDTHNRKANHDSQVESVGDALEDPVVSIARIEDGGEEPRYPEEPGSRVSKAQASQDARVRRTESTQ